ncbi:MAG: nicotinamide mononucleotide transporter, partial [Bacteroidales bacterium]|nr:nicotinamide mononucleotide transporter [Bacteroidales bacterium]
MEIINWISKNYIEIFGALAGVVYVFLEVRQNIWLWPVGIVTSSVYLWVFFTGRLYAEMSLQAYYLVISVIGWCWWGKRINRKRIKEKPQAVSIFPGSLSDDKESNGRDMEGEIW